MLILSDRCRHARILIAWLHEGHAVIDKLLAMGWLVGGVILGGLAMISILRQERSTLDTTRRLLLSISDLIHLNPQLLACDKFPGNSIVLLQFGSLAVVVAEARFVACRKLRI